MLKIRQAGVVVEASPASAFEVVEADFLLEVLVVALDAPPELGQLDQAIEGDIFRLIFDSCGPFVIATH